MSDVSKELKKMNEAISKNNANDFWKYFGKILESTPTEKRSEIWDILGNLSKTNPDLTNWMQMNFAKTLKKMPYNETLEMEENVIASNCVYPSETILARFWGKLTYGAKLRGVSIEGRFYLTQYRIIASGPVWIKSGGGGLIGAIAFVIANNLVVKIQDKIRSKVGTDIVESIGSYGTSVAVFDPYDIKIKKDSVSWNVTLDYEEKGKKKSDKIAHNLKIQPGPKEIKADFQSKLPQNIEALKKIIT
jgi:hypothetical protein